MFKLNHAELLPVKEKLNFVNKKLCFSEVPINVKFGCISMLMDTRVWMC